MPSSVKRKPLSKGTVTRVVALVMAVLLVGSVLLAALFANVY